MGLWEAGGAQDYLWNGVFVLRRKRRPRVMGPTSYMVQRTSPCRSSHPGRPCWSAMGRCGLMGRLIRQCSPNGLGFLNDSVQDRRYTLEDNHLR